MSDPLDSKPAPTPDAPSAAAPTASQPGQPPQPHQGESGAFGLEDGGDFGIGSAELIDIAQLQADPLEDCGDFEIGSAEAIDIAQLEADTLDQPPPPPAFEPPPVPPPPAAFEPPPVPPPVPPPPAAFEPPPVPPPVPPPPAAFEPPPVPPRPAEALSATQIPAPIPPGFGCTLARGWNALGWRGKTLLAGGVAVYAVALLVAIAFARPDRRLTFQNVIKLHTGQTYGEVIEIMGKPDSQTVSHSGSLEYVPFVVNMEWGSWSNPDSPAVVVVITSGSVSLVGTQNIQP